MKVTGKTVFVGSVWAVGMRWGVRLLGLFSVLILARILQPEDFGIIAMAAILAGLVEAFLEFGVGQMIIRKSQVTPDDLNTAWTLRIIQSSLLAIALAASAPLAASFFNEPRVVGVVYLMALAAFLGGFENIGMTLVRKELRFSRDFWYQILDKTGLVVISVSLALALRNFWALALAQVAGQVLKVGLSFMMHSYRPRLGLKGARAFLGFSVHMTLINMARFLGNKLDIFVVGRVTDSMQMGIYNMALDIASMPARELTMATGRALLPTLAAAKSDMHALRQMFLRVIESVAIVCIPMAAGIWVLAEEFVIVLLGEKWRAAVAVVGWLAVYGTLRSLFGLMIGPALIVTGHERRQNLLMWTRALALAVFTIGGAYWGLIGITIGACLANALMIIVAGPSLTVSMNLTYRELAGVLWQPTLAAVLMGLVVNAAIQGIEVLAWRLGAGVFLGVVVYAVALTAIWQLSGRPEGMVGAAIGFLRDKVLTRASS